MKWARRRDYLILVPHNTIIATITTKLVDQTLSYGDPHMHILIDRDPQL
jgi:hypothetical protein